MITVQGYPALDHVSTVTIQFVSQMVDQQICIDAPGQIDHWRNHLDSRPDRVKEIGPSVERFGWLENVINKEFHIGSRRNLGMDISAGNPATSARQSLGNPEISTHPNLHDPAVPRGKIERDAPFNTFIRAHH
jgi:hypothetical protein